MAWVARGSRRNGARAAVTLVVALLAPVSACAGAPLPHAVKPTKRQVSTTSTSTSTSTPTAVPRADAAELGISGSYRMGRRQVTFTEPGHIGPTGDKLGARVLVDRKSVV